MEGEHEIAGLRFWNGDPTVRLLEADEQSGGWVFGGSLNHSTQTVLRSVDGKVVTTDGPFAETKELLGGFWIIEVDDLDAAREWAAKLTVAVRRPIEVRTFEDDDATVQELFEHSFDPIA